MPDFGLYQHLNFDPTTALPQATVVCARGRTTAATRCHPREGKKWGGWISFSPENSQWLGVNITYQPTLQLQEKTLEAHTFYKYLGVTIMNGTQYLDAQHRNLLLKSNQLKGYTWNLARNSYNSYLVSHILWKTVAIIGTNHANDVLVYHSATLKALDRHQYKLC